MAISHMYWLSTANCQRYAGSESKALKDMVYAISFNFFKEEMKMRIIVLMMIAVMMLSVASMGAVGTPDKTSDAAKEKEQVITGEDKAFEPVIIGFKGKLDKRGREQLVKEHKGKISHSYRIINAVASRIPSKAIDKLKKNPNVKYVECDYMVNMTAQQLP